MYKRQLQLTFPNTFDAAPGSKLNFLSFDHDTGRLIIEGTATVSEDGLSVTTDEGQGVIRPGWHGLTPPGSDGEGGCEGWECGKNDGGDGGDGDDGGDGGNNSGQTEPDERALPLIAGDGQNWNAGGIRVSAEGGAQSVLSGGGFSLEVQAPPEPPDDADDECEDSEDPAWCMAEMLAPFVTCLLYTSPSPRD